MLARLLLDANRTVSVERLVDDLWGEDVPESAVKMVQIHVSACARRCPRTRCRPASPATRSQVDPEVIDVVRFERLQSEGRAALDAGDADDRRRALLREALALWRGPALAEFSEPFASVEATHLEERRSRLPRGSHRRRARARPPRRLVGELEALVAATRCASACAAS